MHHRASCLLLAETGRSVCDNCRPKADVLEHEPRLRLVVIRYIREGHRQIEPEMSDGFWW